MRTSAEEYLEELKKLQDGTIKKMTQIPSDEPRFIIDSNTRKITIPDDFTFLGVKNDSYAETIYFEIDRYFDAEDLTKHTIIVQYCAQSISTNGGYPIGIDVVTDVDIETVPGKIIFGWTIKNETTFMATEIAFSIRFYTIDTKANRFSYSFNTLTSNLPVLDTLDVSKEATKIYANILDEWLGKMQEIQDYIDSLDLEALEGKAEEAKNYAISAGNSAVSANTSAGKSKESETNAKASENKAEQYMTSAKESQDASKLSETNAKKSEDSSSKNASDAAFSLQELKNGIASGKFKGEAATIRVGSVIGLGAGETPTVVNVGDEQNAIFDFGIPTASAIDLAVDVLFKLSRTGKIYTTKIPRFASNPTTTCEKLDDNTGLVCSPSTDTVENQDDYENIPLFKWYNCNYLRDEYGHAYPTAIEGLSDDYKTTGSVDVGVIQMTPYVKWDESNDNYILLSITDTPKDGFTAWPTAISNGVIYPYVIHSKYISGIASDGLLRSQPNLRPERAQSYNNMITNYAKKGSGYFGAGEERNAWQIVFNLIKYANKSSQANLYGVANYSFQYDASIQRSEKLTYFPVTKAQAANIVVGNYVSVGYGNISGSTVNKDRGIASVHKYANDVKVLKVEAIDDNNSAVYLDIKDGFDTKPVALSDTISAAILLSSMHSWSGTTDSVKSHHDGSAVSNSDGKHPYRIQGIEYMVGGYTVSGDVVAVFDDQNGKDIYVSPKGVKRTTNASNILATYTNVGNIPAGDFWVGDIGFNIEFGVAFNKTKGSSSATGIADYSYGGGSADKNSMREYLRCGVFGDRAFAGSSAAYLWYGLEFAYWYFLSAD